MPPKKNSENSASSEKAIKEKAPRKRAIKGKVEKPKFKKPTVMRWKLPKSFLTPDCSSSSPKNKKKSLELTPAEQRKIDLANEVALAQLSKTAAFPAKYLTANNAALPAKSVTANTVASPAKSVTVKSAASPGKSATETTDASPAKFATTNTVASPAKSVTLKTPASPAKSVAEKVGKTPVAKKVTKKRVTPPKPKGQPKKRNMESNISETPAPTTEDSEDTSVMEVPKKKKKKDLVKKELPKEGTKTKRGSKLTPKIPNNQKVAADSTSTEVRVKRKYIRKQKVPQCCEQVESTVPKSEATSTPKKRKGKKNMLTSTTDHNPSPSVLEEASKILEKGELTPKESCQPAPAVIDSRKTSTSECLSWTKDISSSSTTTCRTVRSNDFVRIDKKLPVLRLSNVVNEWKMVNYKVPEESHSEDEDCKSSSSSSVSRSSSSSSSSSFSSNHQSSRNSIRQSLNLSSSMSPLKSFTTCTSAKDNDWENILIKLKANLKSVDGEAINYVGYKDQPIDPKIDILQDKVFKLLKHENYVLEVCREIINQCRSSENTTDSSEHHEVNNAYAEDDNSEDDNFQSTKSRYVMFEQNCSPEENLLQTRVYNDENTSEESNYEIDKASFEQTDDDDALSLYAESFTGLTELTKYDSSANSLCVNYASDNEEYIPPMISKNKITDMNYIPTKINDETPLTPNSKNKTVCEKQNADSTSVVARDTELCTVEEKTKAFDMKPVANVTQMIVRQLAGNMCVDRTRKKRPLLMSQIYKILHGTKSCVFRGVCFYNLISNCKKLHCTYPHVELNNIEVRNRLSKLTEELFIQEYMILRNWPPLRRRYGPLYVASAEDRNLTRILVEMAIDFISKAKIDSVQDAALKINVCERTLLHLNDKDLNTCEDLLRFDFGKKILLCHEFLRTISDSQNFTRFKAVFVKLTNFVKEMELIFHLDVATQILERICILPFEEPLAKAMCTILLSTDDKIFENPLIPTFEKQIYLLDQDTQNQYYIAKDNAISRLTRVQIVNEQVSSPKINQEVDINLTHDNREERYTSPDTTKIENSNKPIDETPKSMQIIRPALLCCKRDESATTSRAQIVGPEDMGESRPKFRIWKGKGFGNAHHTGKRYPRPLVRPPPQLPPPPPPKRRPDQRERHVDFGATPSKFPYRPGRSFY